MTDEQAILEAVAAAYQPSGLARVGTGLVRRYAAFSNSVDLPLLADVEREIDFETLRLSSLDGDHATVEVAASEVFSGKWQGRRIRGMRQIAGDAEVVRVEGIWKVADIPLDGGTLLDVVFESDFSGSVDGLELTVLGGLVFPSRSQVRLFVEGCNRLDRPVKLGIVGIGRPSRRFGRWNRAVCSATELPPGKTRFEVEAREKTPAPTNTRRILISTEVGLVDVRPAEGSPSRHMPVLVRVPQLRRDWGVLAVAIASGVLVGAGFAGLVLMLLGLIRFLPLAVSLFRDELTRGRAPWLAWDLGLLVVGGVLFVAGGAATTWHDSAWAVGLGLVAFGALVLMNQLSAMARHKRVTRSRLVGVAAAALVAGLALMLTHGGFHWPRTVSLAAEGRYIGEVIEYETGLRVTSTRRVTILHRGPCAYPIWAVTTRHGKFCPQSKSWNELVSEDVLARRLARRALGKSNLPAFKC